MENQSKNKFKKLTKNPWKWLFFTLLVINIAIFAFVGTRILMPRDQAVLNQNQGSKSGEKAGTITSTTEELNRLLNSYISSQSGGLDYKFYISKQEAVLEASYSVMGISVPFYMYFEPLALDNGSIGLSVKNVSAGSLTLPTETALQILKSYKLPDFVEVKEQDKQVVLNLSKVDLGGGIYLKTNQIDLIKGKFIFDLMKKG